MVRVVIHAGFHKTGTTSVQSMAKRNAAALARQARIFLRSDFSAVTDAARAYSISQNAATLENVHGAALAFFAGLDRGDTRPVALLSEDLSGHLPGRHDIADYGAVPAILAQLAAAAVATWGDALDLRIHLSTRAPAPWLRSAHWQILRSARRTEDPDEFASVFADAADFAAVVAEVARAVAPFPVQAMALEDLGDLPHGPFTPILDLLEVPEVQRAGLVRAPTANARPAGLDEVFLALNRCELPDGKVAGLKKTILRMARRLRARQED